METITKKQTFQELMADSEAIIGEATAFLQQNGTKFPLTDWLTPAEYAKRFGLKSTNVVSNWIKRGVIPTENILHVPELNDIRLIKAVPYQ
ncbi:hypothetical protein [Fibrella aquatilis]|uniref:Uncharacterized protein n=1 Tax=Fibrella aquatilis TaxID=2817059 RepID=A0A939G7L1_9BACT|nr:hypothetical protein [Fibrella aquatilis]MBO0931233.1 hypothetical protein [Fibrella aquatilis]